MGSTRAPAGDRKEVENVETIAVVLSVGQDQVEAFERGFRRQELPIWQDFLERRDPHPSVPQPAGHLLTGGR